MDEQMDEQPCPCGRGQRYDRCCGRLHRGEADAVTAEQLMRSRYSAFAVGDAAYLVRTWDPTTRPRRVRIDPARRWTGLEVVATSAGGMLDTTGTVTFRAHHATGPATGTATGPQAGVLEECSRFARVDGRWVYVDGR